MESEQVERICETLRFVQSLSDEEVARMNETLEGRKARILQHLKRQGGEGGFNDFAIVPALGEAQEMFEAWTELLAEGEIEYAPHSPENIYLARFRVKMQMRLL